MKKEEMIEKGAPGGRIAKGNATVCSMIIMALLLAGLICPANAAEFCNAQGCVDFPQGAFSFADLVVDYSPMIINGDPTTPYRGAFNALGIPDYFSGPSCLSQGGCEFVSLGEGGSITLQFIDNSLTGSGDSTPDLWIFEVGPGVEDTFVEISKDGITWHSVGEVSGSTSGIDIDSFGFGPADLFSYVRLTDDTSDYSVGPTAGADIEAVGAISTVPRLLTCKSLPASTFTPRDSSVTWASLGDGWIYRTGGSIGFDANVDLPSGAKVWDIYVNVADNSAGNDILAWLVECPTDPYAECTFYPTDNTLTTTGSPGYARLYKSLSDQNITIDNLNKSYFVKVHLNATDETNAFRSVQVCYALQISPAPTSATFTDVPVGHWAHQYIEALYTSGITTGYADGTFRAGAYVTRGQMAAFLARALGLYWPN